MLDKKDQKIIKELKLNSRETIRNLSKKTGIRPSTIHQRIKKLKQNSIIEKFTIKLNNAAANENFIVFMHVKTQGDIDNKIFKNHQIKEVFGVTGEYDLILKLKFKDIQEFNNFILKFRKQKGVKNTLTMIATTNIKEEI